MTVAALRERGVAARTRVGFADDLGHAAQVVAEYRAGERWLRGRPLPDGPSFEPAGAVWPAYRAGTADPTRYGGAAAIRDTVFRDLAHANGNAVGLTDTWGGMGPDLVDEIAACWSPRRRATRSRNGRWRSATRPTAASTPTAGTRYAPALRRVTGAAGAGRMTATIRVEVVVVAVTWACRRLRRSGGPLSCLIRCGTSGISAACRPDRLHRILPDGWFA